MFNNEGLFALPILLSRKKEGSPQEVIKFDGGHEVRVFMRQGSIIQKRIRGEISLLSLPILWTKSLVGRSVNGTADRGADKSLLGVIGENLPGELITFIFSKDQPNGHIFHWNVKKNRSQIHLDQPCNKQVAKK